MTLKQLYESTLHDVGIFDQGNVHIDEYNNRVNSAIYNVLNKKYNFSDLKQQSSDDMQVLKGTVTATTGTPPLNPDDLSQIGSAARYSFALPKDYYHLLSCLVTYTLKTDYRCYSVADTVQKAAKRLTSDMRSRVLNDAFQKPDWKRPYYMLRGTNNQILNDYSGGPLTPNSEHIVRVQGSKIGHNNFVDTDADSTADENYGPILEINYGNDTSIFGITSVEVDYLKVPAYLRLTGAQIESVADISPILEFPDYMCMEIKKETVKLILEHRGEPRIQTYGPINETIVEQ